MKLPESLSLRDVVLFNVTAIVELRWISLAAANGIVPLSCGSERWCTHISPGDPEKKTSGIKRLIQGTAYF